MKQISFNVDKKTRLDEFLKKNHISHNLFISIYKDDIFINGKHAKRNSKLEKGDIVTINLRDEENKYEPINMDIEVLYEDDDIFVLNKPDKLTMNKDGEKSLANFVSYLFKQRNIKQKVRFINRLDQDTSGVVMVAKNKIAQAYYQKNSFKKKYLAIVKGNPKDQKIELNLKRDGIKTEIDENGKKSVTILENLKNYGDYSLVSLELLTGRTHQIRVSMEYINCPIVADSLYGEKIENFSQMLHANEIEFVDMKGEYHNITTNLPQRFKDYLKEYLRLKTILCCSII